MCQKKLLILFDVDGTLIKFKSGTAGRIFSDIMEEIFQIKIDKNNLPDFAGQTDLRILREICEINNISFSSVQANIELIWQKMLHLFGKYCIPEYILLLDGVHELLDILSKDNTISLGLLTGNFRENAYQKLKTYNLDNFFAFGAFGSDDEDRNNLPPIAIERANKYFEKKHFTSENTIIVGDAPRDISCAKANNIKVVAVATGNYNLSQLKDYKPDLILENFSDFRSVSLSLCELIQ